MYTAYGDDLVLFVQFFRFGEVVMSVPYGSSALRLG